MISKIQNLNGTHNFMVWHIITSNVVYDVKDTKFEWNSQHRGANFRTKNGCLWCQKYKIWMELTTKIAYLCTCTLLFMMSKIQNLNGTHNYGKENQIKLLVVYDVKDTKFEWNSQLLEASSLATASCLWCQRYKIWMELTTASKFPFLFAALFMMSKIQNLNGTHNRNCAGICALLLFMMSKIQNMNGTHNDFNKF